MSKPIPIGTRLNLDVDVSNLSADQFDGLKERAYSLGKTISESQIKTQSQIVTFSGIDRLDRFDAAKGVMESSKIQGEQLFVPKNLRSIKVSGDARNSYVISEITNTTIFQFKSPVTHLVVTHCKGVVITMGSSIAGIEFINSRNIVIQCESYNFVRATTSGDCKFKGSCNKDTLLDVRNSLDIYFNDERIDTNMFKEGRFRLEDGSFHQISPEEDIARSPSSMPNMSLLKLW